MLEWNPNSHNVIASAAKQSTLQPARFEMDCFAALAMTMTGGVPIETQLGLTHS
jgi:hypothetical protein